MTKRTLGLTFAASLLGAQMGQAATMQEQTFDLTPFTFFLSDFSGGEPDEFSDTLTIPGVTVPDGFFLDNVMVNFDLFTVVTTRVSAEAFPGGSPIANGSGRGVSELTATLLDQEAFVFAASNATCSGIVTCSSLGVVDEDEDSFVFDFSDPDALDAFLAGTEMAFLLFTEAVAFGFQSSARTQAGFEFAGTITYTFLEDLTPIPLPASGLLLLAGLGALGLRRRRPSA